MKTKYWLLLLAAAFGLGALANSQSDGSAGLVKIEGEFMKAAADHGSQGYMSYYADDAVEVPNGQVFLKGKAEIEKTMGFLDKPEQSFDLGACGIGDSSVRRSWLHLWDLRIQFQRQRRQTRCEQGQIRHDLEEAEGRKLEGGAGYGEFGAVITC